MSGERVYTPLVGRSLQFAAEVHARQRRKGKAEPYLSHVLKVVALVIHHGGSETQTVAAALHDAAEDQGGARMLAQIDAMFGPEVARIVRECSDTLGDGTPKPDWRMRKEAYLDHVAQRGPSDSSLVEACDKLANLEDILEDLTRDGGGFLHRFAGGPDGVRWYYRELDRVLLPQAPDLQGRFGACLAQLLAPPPGIRDRPWS